MENFILALAVGLILSAAVGIELAKAAKTLQWACDAEEDEMEEGIMYSVELTQETYDWVWKKTAERGGGTRDFIRSLIEEAKERDEKRLREAGQ